MAYSEVVQMLVLGQDVPNIRRHNQRETPRRCYGSHD